ncbi:MAG: hypothetical protein JNK38_09740, partial [Acidobacteria bacterium]|nr:hypothetical protein [Acidobacteriota bacterium]
MKVFKPQVVINRFFLPTTLCLVLFSIPALAQREYTVVKPRERSASESVAVRTKAAQASKGVLAVVLDPVINGQIIVKDPVTGKLVEKREAGELGKAEFELRRGKIYQIEVSYPGYLSASGKSKTLRASEILRLKLIPQTARFNLQGLPSGAQIFVDDKLQATVGQNGVAAIAEVSPGKHLLRISHSEYNDFLDNFENLEAGSEINYSRIPLTRVAKLMIQGTPGATVLIDGAVQGKIQPDGTVRINYELDRAAERTISVELIGYQSWSKSELLAPGPRTIEVRLAPILTSQGVSDTFDSFIYWQHPSTWQLVTVGKNKKLKVQGSEPGLLKDQVYRDIDEDSSFILWLDDGKGATWVVKADKEGRNYYLFHLAGPKSTTHAPNKFYTYIVRNGAAPEDVSVPFPILAELNQTASYQINIEVSGERIRHWITSSDTGEKMGLGSWTDTSPTKEKFLYGTFGFRSLSGEVFSVDE